MKQLLTITVVLFIVSLATFAHADTDELLKEAPCKCNITGKNICGFIFGDVYPDGCQWITLPKPFYFFDKARLGYNQNNALREIYFDTTVPATYSKDSVIKEVRRMKAALELHFGFKMEETDREDHVGQSKEERIFYCSTSPRVSFNSELCSAWIRVRYTSRGKWGGELDSPYYTISLNIEDKAETTPELIAKRPVHKAVLNVPAKATPTQAAKEFVPASDDCSSIARELTQDELNAMVSAKPKYTWSDIEAKKVVGIPACKAAVELQRYGSHMYQLSLRDKELAQEAVVELSERIDALERKLEALKAK